MDTSHRLARTVGTALVALFLVAGVAPWRHVPSQPPSPTADGTSVTSDQSLEPDRNGGAH